MLRTTDKHQSDLKKRKVGDKRSVDRAVNFKSLVKSVELI